MASSSAKVQASGSLLAAAKAKLDGQHADIAFARSELERITTLVNSRAVNAAIQDEKQHRLRAAEAALLSAEADVKSAESNIAVAEANQQQAEADLAYSRTQRRVAQVSLAHTDALMQYATIRAPFDGQIAYRGIDRGDFVMSAASGRSEPIFTLNRIDRFRIVFDVPESAAALIEPGQPVELTLDSLKGKVFTGEVKRTTGELDKRTRTLRVEAELDNGTTQLRPGMFGMIVTTISQSPSGSQVSNRPAAPRTLVPGVAGKAPE